MNQLNYVSWNKTKALVITKMVPCVSNTHSVKQNTTQSRAQSTTEDPVTRGGMFVPLQRVQNPWRCTQIIPTLER